MTGKKKSPVRHRLTTKATHRTTNRGNCQREVVNTSAAEVKNVLIIPSDVFASLPDLYKGAARLLQREGKVQIVDDSGQTVIL